MGRVKRTPKGFETAISLGILGVLVIIATAVWLNQFRYDPATVVFLPEEIVPAKPAHQSDSILLDLSRFVPDNVEPASPVESFGSANLADKINGKAELYLSAGFSGLVSQRFQIQNDPQSWMEVYVYDMGHLKQAFSVYSMQKRSGAEALALTPFSYRTGNALFFAHGKYYVEVVAAVSSDMMARVLVAFGEGFVENNPDEESVIEEIGLFPQEGQEEGSIAFLVSDAFGCQGMNHIFTALYQVEGREVTAFLSKRKDAQEARDLVASYKDFLVSFGGKEAVGKSMVPGAVTLDMLGDGELIFARGVYVAGVRETDDWALVEVVGKRLWEALGE